MTQRPLIVTSFKDAAVRSALKKPGCDLQAFSSINQLLKSGFQKAPRLFLLRVSSAETDEVCEALKYLRSQRPLTDIVIWAPRARGSTVRTLFLAGAKDVVVSRSMALLVDSVTGALEQQQILPRVNNLARQRSRSSRFESILSRSDSMWDLFDLCTRVAQADATVMICGETGTGKELLARAIHRQSQRTGRFVVANCASIPQELISSELFGHVKGAFTSADRSARGLVLHAEKGTLFLDEIGDMPLESQQTLLRMLQEKRVRPVGSLTETPVDVRVVAATNVALEAAVQSGDFREDLFYRLDVIRMNVPPLRERREDILFLFGHFIKQLAKHYGLEPPTLASSFLDGLVEYSWPGNVRQLENFAERLVVSRPRRALSGRDLDSLPGIAQTSDSTKPSSKPGNRQQPVVTDQTLEEWIVPAIEQLEIQYLEQVLTRNEGRIEQSADQAGISRRTLLRKLRQHGIDKQDYKRS